VKIQKEKIGKIKGFLDEIEAERLYELALQASKRGPCLEIGSYCGKSSVYLGSACKENAMVLFPLTITGDRKSSNLENNISIPIYWIRKPEKSIRLGFPENH